jgi:hypothetical protein
MLTDADGYMDIFMSFFSLKNLKKRRTVGGFCLTGLGGA